MSSYVMVEQWNLWLNVLNVRKKSVSLRRFGRWLEEKTKVAKELNSQLDSLNAVENRSDPF